MWDNRKPTLACVAGAIPAEDRQSHFSLIRDLFTREVEERIAVDTGYQYRFAAESLGRIAKFITNERLCCPFLTFRIDLAEAGGPLWLTITGPAGIREFLDAEFGL